MRLPGPLRAARDAAARGIVIAKTAGRLILNTGKRILPMASSVGITETREMMGGAFGFAIEVRTAMGPSSPGGTRITLDELLHTVSNGELKDSVKNLVAAIERLIEQHTISVDGVFDLIPVLSEAVKDFAITLRNIIRGGMDPQQIVNELMASVSTERLRPELQKAVDGAEKIPGELGDLDMAEMMGLFTELTGWLPRLLKAPA